MNCRGRHPKIKGFRLRYEYPGCKRKKGEFEPYTSGEFLKYPDVWEPVYHKDYLREVRINEILEK